MLQLCNISSWPDDLKRLTTFPGGLAGFLSHHHLDGVELIQAGPIDNPRLPHCFVRGLHLPYWPSWIDFYQGNQARLDQQFPDHSSLKYYYGSTDPTILVKNWRSQLQDAYELGANYAVVHVCHNSMPSCFTFEYDTSDDQVIDYFIKLINQVTESLPTNCLLLMENLWWPGLTLLNPTLVQRLLEEIHYPNKGFMLDIGHLMNTNPSLHTEAQAIKYIMQVLDNLGPLSKFIRGIHLSSSLSGAYRSQCQQNNANWPKPPIDFASFKQYFETIQLHINQLDQHRPFINPQIQKVIQRINPDYLVHELLADSFDQWCEALKSQRKLIL